EQRARSGLRRARLCSGSDGGGLRRGAVLGGELERQEQRVAVVGVELERAAQMTAAVGGLVGEEAARRAGEELTRLHADARFVAALRRGGALGADGVVEDLDDALGRAPLASSSVREGCATERGAAVDLRLGGGALEGARGAVEGFFLEVELALGEAQRAVVAVGAEGGGEGLEACFAGPGRDEVARPQVMHAQARRVLDQRVDARQLLVGGGEVVRVEGELEEAEARAEGVGP